MGAVMSEERPHIDEDTLLRRARTGDGDALGELFGRYRERLRRMIRLRIDDRLHARVEESDVLQEAYLEVQKRFDEYAAQPAVSFLVWLRSLTGQKLVDLHRRHLGAQKRDVGREISLYRGAMPPVSSISLAAQLLGHTTTASQEAIRAETRIRVQEVLNGMDPIDREVLCLRHFEHLSNAETAEVLGLKPAAASNRYVRALKRLKNILRDLPGLRGDVE